MEPSPQNHSLHPASLLKFVSVGGVASLGVSAILFQLASIQDGRIFTLDRAQSLETLASACRLDAMLPLLVAVRGRVTSREPCRGELAGQPSVMRELVEEEVYFKEHSSGRITQECFELRREQEQREAFLEDRTARLKLDNLQHAKGLSSVMEVKQVFHPADLLKGPLIQHVINKAFKSMVKHGTRITERYLPQDTTVTIVGELVHDQVGPSLDRRPAAHAAAQPLPAGSSKAADPAAAAAAPAAGAGAGSDGSPAAAAAARRASGQGAGPSGRTSVGEAIASAAVAAAGSAGAELLGQAVAAAGDAALHVLPYTLRMPSGGPFHVTSMTLPQLRASLERTSKTLRVFAWGFGLLGAVLVARRVVMQVRQERERRRLKRMLAEAETARRQRQRAAAEAAAAAAVDGGGAADGRAAAATGTGRSGAGCGGDEYDDVRGPGICVVCLDRDTDVVFSGCGHMCTCASCTANLHRCPICRVHSRPIRVFRP